MSKILHIITTIERGGAEKQLLILARNQIKLGHNVTVVPLKGDPNLFNDFIDANVKVDLNALNRSIFKQLLIFSIHQRRNDYDVIHGHLPRAEIFSAFLSLVSRCNYVVTRHNVEYFYPNKPKFLSKLISRLVTLRAKRIIAISDYVRTFLLESNEISKKKPVINCLYGYDESRIGFKGSRQITKSKGIENFVTLSRLTPQKDLATMLRGFAQFRVEKNKGFLEIYGNGNQLDYLTRLSEQLGISNFVTFYSNVSNVDEILLNADCFLLTSKYEGFGLVLLECMQLALPVVCSKNSAIVEVMGESYNGYFETGEFKSLSDVMYKLDNQELYNSISKYLVSRVKQFEPSKMAACVLKSYFN